MSNEAKMQAGTGLSIEMYKQHLKSALDISRLMEDNGFERPWIIVKCKRKECSASTVISMTAGIPDHHTHRIRLEIR